MIFPAIFAIIVGLGIICMWTVSFITRQIPEFESEPIRIKFHLAAEFVTALGLIAAGTGLLFKQGWAVSAYLLASGMLLYTVIVSPGYFAQKGQWGYVIMFSGILLLALIGLLFVL